MNNRTLSAITLGALIIALGVSLIVYVASDEWTMILWVTMLIFGAALFALSFLYSGESGKFGPSESVYRMVVGIILLTAGAIGVLSTYTEINAWILIAAFIIVVALVGIVVAIMNGKKEET